MRKSRYVCFLSCSYVCKQSIVMSSFSVPLLWLLCVCVLLSMGAPFNTYV